MTHAPRVLFFGTRCAASAEVLDPLAGAGFDVRVVVPGPGGHIPASAATDPLSAVAARAGFPMVATPSIRHANAWAALAGPGVDLLVTACFPWRVPTGLIASASRGAVNVHPSLLPLNRGPHPVFWTVRRGERTTGVTIHLLTDTFDAGPILARQANPVPTDPPLPIADLERLLFRMGGGLLPGVLRDLLAGTARPEPQDDHEATSAPVPGQDDYLVSTGLPAAWAYQFVRAVRGTGPATVVVGATGETVAVADALALGPPDPGAAPIVRRGATVTIRFLDGTVTFAVGPLAGSPPGAGTGPDASGSPAGDGLTSPSAGPRTRRRAVRTRVDETAW
ncbi:MAG: hypothetical protein M3462_05205 [Chloroflexota bacterium]|nr:hypothetical protein [Chloroflexota bacterium]